MQDDCEVCGALWNRHLLSVVRPECKGCEKRICPHCDATTCETCGAKIHVKCAWMIGNEHHCEKCWDWILREAVKEFDMDQQLELSAKWLAAKSHKRTA